MKSSIKFLGLAALAMVFAVACNNNKAAEAEDTTACDTTIDMVMDTTIEAEAIDSTTVEPETTVPTKKVVKKEQVKPVTTSDAKSNIKADAKDVASKMKEGEGKEVKAVSTENTTMRKDPRANAKNMKEGKKQ